MAGGKGAPPKGANNEHHPLEGAPLTTSTTLGYFPDVVRCTLHALPRGDASPRKFLDWFIPNNLEAIAWLTGNIESGGIYNGTITHGDFRLENLFFEKEGKNGAPKKAAFIDFQIMHCGGMSLQA